MALHLISRLGLPGNVFAKVWNILQSWRALRANSGWSLATFINTCPGSPRQTISSGDSQG